MSNGVSVSVCADGEGDLVSVVVLYPLSLDSLLLLLFHSRTAAVDRQNERAPVLQLSSITE